MVYTYFGPIQGYKRSKLLITPAVLGVAAQLPHKVHLSGNVAELGWDLFVLQQFVMLTSLNQVQCIREHTGDSYTFCQQYYGLVRLEAQIDTVRTL